MTPKEKAINLIEQFRDVQWIEENIETIKVKWLQGDEAKQCALIAVDEIIEFMECDDFDSDTCYWANHSKMEYFLQVKKEIEKI